MGLSQQHKNPKNSTYVPKRLEQLKLQETNTCTFKTDVRRPDKTKEVLGDPKIWWYYI